MISSTEATTAASIQRGFLMGLIGKQIKGKGLSFLTDLLMGQKEHVQAALPSGMGGLLGFADMAKNIGGAVTGAAESMSGAAGNAMNTTSDAVKNVAGAAMGSASDITKGILARICFVFEQSTSSLHVDQRTYPQHP